MRYTKLFSLLIFFSLLLYSCNICNNLDCITGNYYGQFRIVSAVDGKDLVFGAAKVYDKSQIKFYSLKGTDTTFFDSQAIRSPGTGYDSILHTLFYPDPDIAYMRLSNGDIDTLNISYSNTKTKCCGTITEIINYRFNNLVNIPGDKGTQEIKK